MKNKLLFILLQACLITTTVNATDFKNVGVHDPSVIRTPEGVYYVIGSHMAGAKTTDLMRWTQLGTSVNYQPYFKDIKNELSEALAWGQTSTFWAGEYARLANGKYYMYYCVCEGSCPQGAIGYAVSDSPEGPFENLGILRRSSGYNATIDPGDGSSIAFLGHTMPNCIDPALFYDKEGRLWMVYGSYSGGLFILEMNPEDGSIKEGQSVWGTLLTGGDHVPVEGAYILYSPDTDYYYLFVSMGGLGANDGYNLRVARSKTPNGIYRDAKGQSMLGARNNSATMYNYGLKLVGNHQFLLAEGESGEAGGYISPGHNSAYYDSITGNYYMIFHTRFPGKGESHEVRVHQMFMTEEGWPVLAPYRYAGEQRGIYDVADYVGAYKMINFGTGESKTVIDSKEIKLNSDFTITGAVTGRWRLDDEEKGEVTMRLGTATYRGVFLYQGDPYTKSFKMTFTLSGSTNECVWGSKILPAELESTDCDLEEGADYLLLNYHSGFYLSATGYTGEADQPIQQWAYDPTKEQVFRLRYVNDGMYQLQSAASDYQTALCIEAGSTVSGRSLVTCLSSDTLTSKKSLFKISKLANGTYSLRSRGTSNAIRVRSNSTQSGAIIEQYTYNKNTDAMHWVFIKVANKDDVTSVTSLYEDENEVEIQLSDRSLKVSATEMSRMYVYHISGVLIGSCESTLGEFENLRPGSYVVTVVSGSGKRVSRRVQIL